MTYTKKYYIMMIVTAPCLTSLIAFSNMSMLAAFVLGVITEIGLLIGGYYLGKRDSNK